MTAGDIEKLINEELGLYEIFEIDYFGENYGNSLSNKIDFWNGYLRFNFINEYF